MCSAGFRSGTKVSSTLLAPLKTTLSHGALPWLTLTEILFRITGADALVIGQILLPLPVLATRLSALLQLSRPAARGLKKSPGSMARIQQVLLSNHGIMHLKPRVPRQQTQTQIIIHSDTQTSTRVNRPQKALLLWERVQRPQLGPQLTMIRTTITDTQQRGHQALLPHQALP